MNYKLVKRLKDAGFSQNIECNHHPAEHCSCYRDWKPTLSELIKACGDDFKVLYNVDEVIGWEALNTMGYNPLYGHGKTPEEAVSELWLQLNKQNDKSKKNTFNQFFISF